ncbi:MULTISPECIES: transposase [Streptomyces]|uniref:transposase n=1 Tax=Streptomyces tendae TaxID=1932 RepID=UPI003819251D
MLAIVKAFWPDVRQANGEEARWSLSCYSIASADLIVPLISHAPTTSQSSRRTQSRPDATIRSVAADLGINPETLRNWVRAIGASRPRRRRTQEPAQPPEPLEAENAALGKKVRKLEEEREILREATKYFVGETRW